MNSFLGAGHPPTPFLPVYGGLSMYLSLLPDHTHPITILSREGMGARALAGGVGWGWASGYCCQALPQLPNLDAPSSSHLPPLFPLQMESHTEEVPVMLRPDLLTVRKSGVSRTHSLPNDSYMCQDGSTAEGSLGHRGWGLPKAQSGTKAGGRPARLTPGDPSLPKPSPVLGK